MKIFCPLPVPRSLLLALFIISLAGKSSAALSAVKTESKNSQASSSSVSSGSNARFTSGRILLIATNAHPLLQEVAAIILRDLKTNAYVEEVVFLGPGNKSATSTGGRSPDLFLMLDLARLSEKGVINRSIELDLITTLGTAPWQSRHSVINSDNPPLIKLHWKNTLQHRGQRKGIETSRHQGIARSVGADLSKAIQEQILHLHLTHDSLPELPANFYGPYRAAPEFPFLKALKARQRFSHEGLWTHNQTFWTFPAPTGLPNRLEELQRDLRIEGWNGEFAGSKSNEEPRLYLTRDRAILEIFDPNGSGVGPGSATNGGDFCIRYQETFSRNHLKNVLEEFLSSSQPAENLLIVEHAFSSDQRARLYQQISNHPVVSVKTALSQAKFHLNQKDTNAARQSLIRAKALSRALDKPPSSEIEELTRKLVGKGMKLEPARADYVAAGFLHRTNGEPQMIEKERGLPLLLIGKGITTVHLKPAGGVRNSGKFILKVGQAYDGGYSSSSTVWDLNQQKEWKQEIRLGEKNIDLKIEPVEGGKRFRYHLRP